MPGGDLDTATEATRPWDGRASGRTEAAAAGGAHGDEAAEAPDPPVMPSPPPFPTFQSRPALPHQSPGVGFESGRDSRAR